MWLLSRNKIWKYEGIEVLFWTHLKAIESSLLCSAFLTHCTFKYIEINVTCLEIYVEVIIVYRQLPYLNRRRECDKYNWGCRPRRLPHDKCTKTPLISPQFYSLILHKYSIILKLMKKVRIDSKALTRDVSLALKIVLLYQ